MTLDEVPFFFPSGERRLFGLLHKPTAATEGRPAFVFCHPLAEEKLWTHRVFVAYARQLAAAGYPVLRFDATGNGDSGGSFSDLSFEILCADLHSAIREVRERSDATAVSLLGLRLGANVAMTVAESAADVRHVISWAPVTDGERYLQDLLRINLMTQMTTDKAISQERPALVAAMQQGRTVNIDGYEMGWPLYSSVSTIKADVAARRFAGPCLIVQIDRHARPAADLERLASAYPSATVQSAQEEAFWKEIPRFYQNAPHLFEITTAWLGAH